MKLFFLSTAMTLSLLNLNLAHAEQGTVGGGGGDVVTEKRIKDIRDNLLFDFINKGGDKALDFKGALTLSEYEIGLKQLLVQGAVVVNAIKASDEDLNDELKNTRVNGARKICKGIAKAKTDGRPYIICDVDAFGHMDADPEKNADLQTIQIAHEYYGLARIEKNIGSDSDYWLSKQLQAHMGYKKVRMIVVDDSTLSSALVSSARKLLSLSVKNFDLPNISTIQNLTWAPESCQGEYLALDYYNSDDQEPVGSWKAFPMRMSFRFERNQYNLLVATDFPNIPYISPDHFLDNPYSESSDRLSDLRQESLVTAKLIDKDTLIVEVSARAKSELGYQLTAVLGNTRDVVMNRYAPFAYFICKH